MRRCGRDSKGLCGVSIDLTGRKRKAVWGRSSEEKTPPRRQPIRDSCSRGLSWPAERVDSGWLKVWTITAVRLVAERLILYAFGVQCRFIEQLGGRLGAGAVLSWRLPLAVAWSEANSPMRKTISVTSGSPAIVFTFCSRTGLRKVSC